MANNVDASEEAGQRIPMFDQRPSAGTVAERNEGLEGWNKLGRGPTTARVTEPCRETCTPANAIVRGKLCSYPSSPPCISLLSSLSSCSQPVYTHSDAFSLTGPFHAVGHGVIVIVCRGGKCVDESDHVEFQNNLNMERSTMRFSFFFIPSFVVPGTTIYRGTYASS